MVCNKLAETGVQLSDEANKPKQIRIYFSAAELVPSLVLQVCAHYLLKPDNQSWIKIFTSFKLKIQLIVTHDNFLAGNKFDDEIKGAVQLLGF